MLFGCMTISACSPAKPDEQSKQMFLEKTSATDHPIHKEVGSASWYGPGLNGKETANGDIFDQSKLTAAHPSLPMGTKAKVTNLENGKKVDVKINDRGPFVGNRVIDVSKEAAKKLDMEEDGTTQVKIETIKKKTADAQVQSDKTK
jgi:rare lipoprotein A